jgi:putative peptidoglycan lipid II flippase
MSSSSLFKAAGLIAAVTILSKFLGLFRDQFIAHAYGASMVSDAYLYAFQIPSFALILLGGLGGPFHTATIAVLSRMMSPDSPPTEDAKRLVNAFMTLTGTVFALASVAVWFWARPIVDVLAADATPELRTIAAMHLQWMSPMILIGGVIGIFYGISNLYKQYFWPSISPSAINVTLILWLWILGPDESGLSLAISTLLGAGLQLLIQIPEFYAVGFRFAPAWMLRLEGMKTLSQMLLPATVGTTIGQLNVYVAMFFTSQLAAGSWTAFVLGNRLIQLPIGVLTIAMLVPLFPRFNQWVTEKNTPALRDDFHLGVLSMWLLGLPFVVITLLLAPQGIALLFERGAFTARDTALVRLVLQILAISVLPYMLRDGLTRVFYAFQDSKTPLLAGVLSIVLNAVLNALLVSRLDIAGIAISTVAVTISNALVLMLLIPKHTRDLQIGSLFGKSFRMASAAIISGCVAWACGQGVVASGLATSWPKWAGLVLEIGLVSIIVLFTYALILVALKDPLAHRVGGRLWEHPKLAPLRRLCGRA